MLYTVDESMTRNLFTYETNDIYIVFIDRGTSLIRKGNYSDLTKVKLLKFVIRRRQISRMPTFR